MPAYRPAPAYTPPALAAATPMAAQARTGGQDLSGYPSAPTQYAPGIGLTQPSDMNTAPVSIPWNGSPMPTGPVPPYQPPPYVPNNPFNLPVPSSPYTDPTNTNWWQVVPGI